LNDEFVQDCLPPCCCPTRGFIELDDEKGVAVRDISTVYNKSKVVITDSEPTANGKPVPQDQVIKATKIVLGWIRTKVIDVSSLFMGSGGIWHGGNSEGRLRRGLVTVNRGPTEISESEKDSEFCRRGTVLLDAASASAPSASTGLLALSSA
jgi:hypothetical protein